ncbi:MAG: cyclic nucleotide-binding domain-containing protein [Polyangiaceae bacterium]
MKIEAALRTDVGRVRDHNEDYALVDEALGLFVVCDGMGGHAAGEVAAQLACQTVVETIRAAAGPERVGLELTAAESGRLQAVMSSALENANARVRQLSQSDVNKRGAGTTCAALLIRHGRGFVGHVGDSRIYLARQGALHRLTVDHSLVEHAVAQGIPRELAMAKFPSNPLVRAIGLHDTVLVDTMVFDILPEDAVLLCSDGLYDYLADAGELTQQLAGAPAPAAESLVALANHRGGRDNITALVIRVRKETAIPQSEEVRHTRVREDLAALWRMPLFHDMSYPELLELIEAANDVLLERDQIVVTEGEESDSLYVIADGSVRIERAGQALATLGPGCHFGEMAVLTSRPRSATVRANGPARLIAFSRAAIHDLFSRRPAIGMKFLWTLAQVQSIRLDEAQVWGADAEAVSALKAMESTVVIQSRENGEPTYESSVETQRRFPPPLSRHR